MGRRKKTRGRKAVTAREWDPPEEATPIGFAEGIAGDFVDRAYRKILRMWEKTVDAGFFKVWRSLRGFEATSNLFNRFLKGDKHQIHAITYDNWINMWLDMLQAVMVWSIFTEPDIMDEFLGEMIQEAMSYAIQTSMGGTLQTILNTYMGGSPYPSDSTSQVGRILDALDKRLASFVTASAGFNTPTAAVDLLFGVLQTLDDKLADLREQTARWVEDWNDIALLLPRVAYAVVRSAIMDALTAEREVAERYAHVKEQIARTHLARANEYLDTLESYKALYDAGMISDEMLEELCVQVKLEIEASMRAYDEAVTLLEEAYDEAVRTAREYARLAVKRAYELAELFKRVLDRYNARASEAVEGQLRAAVGHLWETIDGVASYRNMPSPVSYRVVRPVREFKPPVTAELRYSYTMPAIVAVTEKGKATTPQVVAAREKGKFTAPQVVATEEKGKYTTPSTGT